MHKLVKEGITNGGAETRRLMFNSRILLNGVKMPLEASTVELEVGDILEFITPRRQKKWVITEEEVCIKE